MGRIEPNLERKTTVSIPNRILSVKTPAPNKVDYLRFVQLGCAYRLLRIRSAASIS